MNLQKRAAPKTPIKTPQELVHIKHKITLRQYKYWVLFLKSYREAYEGSIPADDAGFHRISANSLKEYLGYEPVKAELRSDLEAIRKEAIIYNVLGKDGKTSQRGSGFISEWEVSSSSVGFKLPGFLVDCVERLDLKNAMFQALNWAVFNSFSGKYEAVLYKLCKDYVGVRRTPQMPIEQFREYMGLNEGEYAEFKDLNKFVISGPIKKINENKISDISIEVNFKKESRRVVGLQFFVTHKQQAGFSFGDDPAFAAARVTISLAQQQKYLGLKPPEEIALAIERANTYTDEQESKGLEVNIGAVYQTAITQGWGAEYLAKLAIEQQRNEKLNRMVKAKTNSERSEAANKEESDRTRREVMDQFRSLSGERQEEIFKLFGDTLVGVPLAEFKKRGISSPLISNTFATWLTGNPLG
ncbi:MAG: RepB family plasmid replication initiator protein [Rhodocyclaceae bacterium]|nr:MAG: RepB family plasmid replication initiator protein [Rhodocyclaceae bacterium]